jgi:hypothetical protein
MFNIYRSQEAVTPLREAYEQADEELREAILQASRLVNLRLHEDPHSEGESRDTQTRILFQAPVGVLYEVDEDKKLVNILRSWAFRRATASQGDLE